MLGMAKNATDHAIRRAKTLFSIRDGGLSCVRAGLILTIAACALSGCGAKAEGSRLASTVYGKGAEIHLLPDWGPVGTQVQVFGRGFQPGQVVRVSPGIIGADMGLTIRLAQTRVRPDGSFRTAWRVTCSLIYVDFYNKHPRKRCRIPGSNGMFFILVGAYGRHARSLGAKTQTTGFTITSSTI